MADLDQVAVAKWNHLASLRPLAVDQGPVPEPSSRSRQAPSLRSRWAWREEAKESRRSMRSCPFCGAAAGRRCAADIHFVD